MTRTELLRELEDMLELPPQTLRGDESLTVLDNWDSMASLRFIMLAEDKLGHVVDGVAVSKAKSVADLVSLVAEHLQP
jgi:acyl carrier protein